MLPESHVTIGLPVYNAMPYLQETMDSLFRQTSPNFEILAVVDGGNDGSLEYLRSLRDPRLRVLEQSNQGVTPTLNRVLRECRTRWLIRQDADDISYPDRVEKVIAATEAYPDAGMFYSFARYYPQDRAVGCFRCSRGTPEDLREIVQAGYLLAICHCSAVLNVPKTRKLGGYRVGMHNEDGDLWWRMALQHDIRCIPEELVGFRQNPSSVSSKNLAEQVLSALYVQYLLLSYLWKLPPRPMEEVRNQLAELLPNKDFRAKDCLRGFNMSLMQRHYTEAAENLAASFAASPSYLLRRVKDELFPTSHIANGIKPELYRQRRQLLWA